MACFLLSIIFLAILVAWNADEYIKKYGDFPPIRKLLLSEIQKQHKRAYYFMFAVGVALLLCSAITLSEIPQLAIVFLDNISDVSLIAIYLSVLVNYLFRLKIYVNTNGVAGSVDRRIYMWEVWVIKSSLCNTAVDRRNLFLSNCTVGVTVLIYIVWSFINS